MVSAGHLDPRRVHTIDRAEEGTQSDQELYKHF